MRGKADRLSQIARADGITPAHAGKRHDTGLVDDHQRDHPRACGEKPAQVIIQNETVGSPPRMRGKENQKPNIRNEVGITPAHAGKRSTRVS